MVSTRNHPKQFPPPDLSPSKSHHAKPSPTPEPAFGIDTVDTVDTVDTTRPRARSVSAWSHAPSNLVITWLCISLPLVLWDTGYVLGRPHTMPGGAYHALWKPYALYVNIDYLYSFTALARNDGFTGAQGFMNLVETATYLVYVYLVFTYGWSDQTTGTGLFAKRKIVGREAGVAALVGFSAAIMTLSKTILYVLVGHFAGWETLKDNTWSTIIFLWIIPNGAWILMPSIMSYIFGSEILQGLEQAAGLPQKKTN